MSANVKLIVSALALASKSLKELPPAPTFDYDARLSIMLQAFEGMPDADTKAKNACDRLSEQFTKAHGDTSDRFAKTVLAVIADSLGGIEELAKVARDMASEARSAGKLSITGSEFEKALKGEKDARADVQTIVDKASDMRKQEKPAPWSEIEEKLNLSPSTRQALYVLSPKYPELFPKAV